MIRAHFDGKAFIPDAPVPFRVNQAVTLHVDAMEDQPPSAAEIEQRLQAFAELEKLAAGPAVADWSRESIYSTQKKLPSLNLAPQQQQMLTGYAI
ncbi:MAG: hypothetical protein FWD61_16315 [Phycisphaerales bacterium]|nr:hypothetical protein [Phycisphaerales bacterium]